MSTYLNDYDYFLPEELIGQKPREPRDSAKLMLIDRKTGSIEHKHFYNIVEYLQKGDVLVRNATKVIPARIFGHKDTGYLAYEIGYNQAKDVTKILQDNNFDVLSIIKDYGGNNRVIIAKKAIKTDNFEEIEEEEDVNLSE